MRTLPFLLTIVLLATAACAPRAASPATSPPSAVAGKVSVVAAEDVWGSLAAQVGGNHATVTSLIANPVGDPHDFEPTPAAARQVAGAQYVILNGAGYDAWMEKLLAANPVTGRRVLNIAALLGQKAGANPHFWYDPDAVGRAIEQIRRDLQALDPADTAYFTQQATSLTQDGLQQYRSLITTIKIHYQGTPIGATESLFDAMASALGLRLVSPPGFMQAVAQGVEPSVADKTSFDRQIASKQLAVLLYNQQDATPDTDGIKQEAQAVGIPVVAITETVNPPTATFQAWQAAQLQALAAALARSAEE